MRTIFDSFTDRLSKVLICFMSIMCFLLSNLGADTPDTFEWSGPDTANWDDAGVWSPESTSRTAPGISGDTAFFNESNHTNIITVTMDGEKTLSHLKGYFGTITITSGDDAVLVFDTPDNDGIAVISCEDQGSEKLVYDLNLGDYIFNTKEVDPDFQIVLEKPLHFKLNNMHNQHVYVIGKVTGGTEEDPKPIYITNEKGNWYSAMVVFTNPDNDFTGDIYLGDDTDFNKFMGLPQNLWVT